MATELQQLLEKIQREGVEKANADAAAVLKKAEEKAAAIVKAAEEQAVAAKAGAERESAAFAERAKVTIAQAARDVVIETGNSITKLLEKVLAKNVDAALADPAVAVPLAASAVRELAAGDGSTLLASAKLVESLRAALAAEAAKGLKIEPGAGRSGFSVRVQDGRVEHDFTGPALAAAIASHLRPALAELVG